MVIRYQTLVRYFASFIIVAGITFFYYRFFTAANSTTVALTFLLGILGIATAWGLIEGIVASVAAMLCFNFFFLPPFLTLTVADTQNWVALFAFLVTAVVASQLSASARKRALEAMRRQQEMERLYEFSRALLLLDKRSATASQVSQRIAQVFDVRGVAVFDRQLDKVYRTGAEDLPVSDGKLRDSALQGTPFHDPAANLWVQPLSLGGEPLGSLSIYKASISDTAAQAIANLAAITIVRVRVEEAANRMEAARQNEAMKSMLLDALAHEFKTPLTSIKAAASSILDEAPPAQKELVTVIDEETDRLDSLVNETIRMARIEAGELRLERQPQVVGHLITAALNKLRILLEDREVCIDAPDDLPEILADAELVGLTIRQLVTNALKYSNPESPIVIRARAENGYARISVKDSGPGIPQTELPRIFEKYYRVEDGTGRIPGTGMGLSIARDIVKAHGGEIWAESLPGQGSEFFLTLPLAEKKS
ncbi:MAG TPA: ATP-binding protein [Terriglobia bacterium]|nr:ATP-binding protein [Terriglobia bacterium]